MKTLFAISMITVFCIAEFSMMTKFDPLNVLIISMVAVYVIYIIGYWYVD